MTTKNIMTSSLFTLKPTDTVADAITLMHQKHVRNLPVVDDEGMFIGLFGLRRVDQLILPIAASSLGSNSISDLQFLPDEIVQMDDRWHEVANQPVVNFLEKEKKLMFCAPETAFPEMLAMLNRSQDSSLPVLVVEGDSKKLVGMVSPWDVLERIIIGQLVKPGGERDPAGQEK
jgi:CBS domain-containing protein